MATHDAPIKVPGMIHHARWCRNGEPVLSSPMRKVADAINFITARTGKCIFHQSRDLPALGGGAAGTNNLWRCYGYAGYGVSGLRVVVLCKPADNAAAVDPRARVSVTHDGGTVAGTFRYPGITATSTVVPSNLTYGIIDVAVDADSALDCVIQEIDYLRIVSACVFTIGDNPVDDTGTGGVNPQLSVGTNILDSQHLDIATAVTGLWQKNAAHIFSWAADGTANSPTRAGTTYRNILDSSSTSVTAATPGIRVQFTGRNRIAGGAGGKVPTRLAVYAQRTAGAGTTSNNAVRISDGSDTITVSGIGNTPGWFSADSDMAVGADLKFDVLAKTDAADTIRIDAVCWMQYQ